MAPNDVAMAPNDRPPLGQRLTHNRLGPLSPPWICYSHYSTNIGIMPQYFIRATHEA
jgi:hypothetical protein